MAANEGDISVKIDVEFPEKRDVLWRSHKIFADSGNISKSKKFCLMTLILHNANSLKTSEAIVSVGRSVGSLKSK
ncbi:hypothetical protein ES703_87113 [subsurface metagenome]